MNQLLTIEAVAELTDWDFEKLQDELEHVNSMV